PSCPRVSRGFEKRACARLSRRTPDAMQRGGPGGLPAKRRGGGSVTRHSSPRVIELALMAYSEYPNLVLRRHELVERDIAGPAVGNDQLAQIPFHAAADQGVA